MNTAAGPDGGEPVIGEATSTRLGGAFPQPRLRELLTEVQDRIEEIVGVQDRMDALLEAILSVSSGLDLETTLRALVRAAMQLVEADYGALGVLGDTGELEKFYFEGIEAGTAERIGRLPRGHGVLGALLHEGEPLRLTEIAEHPGSVGFPPHHPVMSSFLGMPVLARGEVFGRLYLTDKRGGAAFTKDDEVVVRALAASAATAIDNARLFGEVRRHERWLEASSEISAELLAGAEAPEALQLIVDRAIELSDADYALIALPEDDRLPPEERTELSVTVCAGEGLADLKGRTIPVTESTTGQVFTSRKPRAVDRLAFDIAEGSGFEFGPALAVPMHAGETISGVLLVIRRPAASAFTEQQVQMVSSFADQAALAMQRAEAQSARRQLDVLADRDRIARDLHDQVIQRLFGIGLAMQGTHSRVRSPAIADRLAEHIGELHDTVQDIRLAIFDLHAGTVTGGLRDRLQRVIAELTGEGTLRVIRRISGPLELVPAALAEDAEAVLREAISNVVRHARATELTITVSLDDHLILEVTDNGIGLPDRVGRSGLHNLAERAAQAGGDCTVERIAGGGTRLVWWAPLP
ncbi:GAF domain-containing sensor histidine kinase [Sciscionella sediminilitoris]|uniref:GAF domain-containing sensor histidine kinase n=1 Tax=Sciscionella sediminilitoris TaxID=1445613 RepID=UPI0009E75556|nr:GAF domain-containing sensor histidine kinase [Sciscionella sp. SE31]